MDAPRGRDAGLDALKGVAILMVVGIHVLAVGAAGLTRRPQVVSGALLLASVPAFMAVSALLLARDLDRGAGAAAVARRIARLVPVYAAWTLIYPVAALVAGGPEALWVRHHSLTGVLLLGDGWYHLYFLPALAAVLLAVPLLRLAVGTRRGAWAVLVVGVSLLAATGASGAGSTLELIFASHWALVWLPSAAVGIAVASGTLRVRRPGLWCAAGFATVVAETLATLHRAAPNPSPYAKAGLPIAVAGLVALALSRPVWPRPLVGLGRRSLGVYLMHPALLWAAMSLRHHRIYPAWVALPATLVVAGASWALTAAFARTPAHGLVDGRFRRAPRHQPAPRGLAAFAVPTASPSS